MEFKVVLCDPETGRAYQRVLKDEKAKRIKDLKLGDEFDGGILGLTGYGLMITGGSDKCGFPMKKGVHGTKRSRILLSGGVGYKPKREVRRRKRVRGEKLDEDIVQVNTKIVKRAKKSVEELLGIKVEEKLEEKPAEEPKPKEKKTDKKG